MRRAIGIAVFALLAGLAFAGPAPTVPIRDEGFSASSLRANRSFFLLDPSRFGMQQSYTMSYTGSSFGSYSAGIYLNTLSYRFAIPLTLSVDVGMYNMFHNSFDAGYYAEPAEDSRPQFVLPRIGLEYRPTSNVTMSLQIVQFPDAIKAYGPMGYCGFWGCDRFSRMRGSED